LNSKIRSIQLYDKKAKIVYYFVHGEIKNKEKIKSDIVAKWGR